MERKAHINHGSAAVANVGLMAQKAEEYGSHPTTFEIKKDGVVRYILESGDVLHEHQVKAGDIWRSSTAKKAPILDWINLAITRQNETNSQAIFWLDEKRPHDAELIKYVKHELENKNLTKQTALPCKTTKILETTTKISRTLRDRSLRSRERRRFLSNSS